MQKHVLNFKMHISREPLILEQEMSSFDQKSFMGIVKFSVRFDIPSKYIEDYYVIVSVIVVGIFSERLTDTFYQDFPLWFLAFLWLWLKLIQKMCY